MLQAWDKALMVGIRALERNRAVGELITLLNADMPGGTSCKGKLRITTAGWKCTSAIIELGTLEKML
jgi:hypothetical protein